MVEYLRKSLADSTGKALDEPSVDAGKEIAVGVFVVYGVIVLLSLVIGSPGKVQESDV